VNSSGQSAYSNTVSVATPGLTMVAPTNLRATAIRRTSVTLSWNDNSNNEQGFYVQRSSDNGVTWPLVGTTGINVSTFRDNGVARRTTYLYRVQAFNSSGGSGFSNTLTVTTP
jgi:hypothetical protein